MHISEDSPPSPAFSSLLNPECTRITTEEGWPGTVITEIDCYGGSLGFKRPEDWDVSNRQHTIVALGSVGFSMRDTAETVGASLTCIEDDRDKMIKRLRTRLPGKPYSFAGCINAFIDAGIINVLKPIEPVSAAPPYFGPVVRAWAESKNIYAAAAKHGHTLPPEVKKELLAFRRDKRIMGRGPAALVTWAYMNGL